MDNPKPPAMPSPTNIKRGARGKLGFVLFGVVALVIAGLSIVVILEPSLLVRTEKSPVYPQLKTAGTSVVAVMVENRWKGEYLKNHGVQVNYESTGSTTGIERLAQKQASIAFTHAPISPDQRTKLSEAGGDVVQIPILICSVAPVYNLPQLKNQKPLNFTGEILGKIFLGEINKWNDPQLQSINKDVPLPPTAMTVVHRQDSSGTTLIFTDYLARASKQWANKFPQFPHGAAEISWPVGLEAKRNMNLAVEVSRIEGAIGYVDLLYTHFHELELEFGAIQNGSGTEYVRPNPETMAAAGQAALPQIKDDLILEVANMPGGKAYPISGVIYAVCYKSQPSATRDLVVNFLQWATHEGQSFVAGMSYAPLPSQLTHRVDERLKSIRASE